MASRGGHLQQRCAHQHNFAKNNLRRDEMKQYRKQANEEVWPGV